MTPQYQFNLGQGDPLLTSRVTSPEQFYDNISQEIERLNALKQQFTQQPIKPQPQVDVWSEIDKEVAALTNDQKQILAQDETYVSIEQELQFMIQQELINSVKGKVANTPRGKELNYFKNI